MPRPNNKLASSRSTPRPSTRSQQQSPSLNKPSVVVNLKNPSIAASSSRGEVSDNDNESVCSSSKSSDVVVARSSAAKGKVKDDYGVPKSPWRHPDELDYFRPYDWSEDKIISQLRSMVFTVPPPVFGKQSFIEVSLYDGGDFDKPQSIKVPRGYRVPLMFVAKFQWASLKLVLTSAQREKEWSDYKFDILHLSRLCERFISRAHTACKQAVVELPQMKTRASELQVNGAMTRKWRCPTFDRALARYNKNWLISREEFLRDFYIEFEDEEYAKDVLKIDWSRWALKGHKGFKLTQEELRCGIDGRMITRGLKKDSNGKWIWVDDYVIKQEEVASAVDPLKDEVTTATPPVDQTSPQNEEPAQPAPTAFSPPPPPNGHLPSHTNGQVPPQSTSPPAVTATAEAPVVNTTSVPPALEIPNQVTSDETADNTTKQPSPDQDPVEKSHSPLSSLPSSASPSVPPPNVSEHQATSDDPPTVPSVMHGPSPASPDKPVNPSVSSPPSPPPEASLPTLAIPPGTEPSQSSPDLPRPSPASIVSSAHSEGTQPPKSPSLPSIPSPEGPSRSVEPVSDISTLRLRYPDASASDHGQSSIYENGAEESGADLVDPRFSPTSIDSTPTPSPKITPEEEPAHPVITSTAIPNTASNGPYAATTQHLQYSPFELLNAPWLDNLVPVTQPPIADSVSQPTPYWLPPRSFSPEFTEPEKDDSPKPTPQSHSPVFINPLLPPPVRSRSASPDEIPGLGALSSNRTWSLPPQFVAPTITARTVTDGSSWHMTEPGKELEKESEQQQGRQEIHLVVVKLDDDSGRPQEHMTEVNGPNINGSSAAERISIFKGDAPSPPKTRATAEPTPPIDRLPPSTPPPAEPRPQAQSSDYDDDSDMDFGTPVTSPVIIVPGPKVNTIELLPPPFSPCPAPIALQTTDMALRAATPTLDVGERTPKAVAPRVVTPRVVTPTTTPKAQASQITAPMLVERTEPENEAIDQGSPMEIHDSPMKEQEAHGQSSHAHLLQTLSAFSQTLVPTMPSTTQTAPEDIPPLPPLPPPSPTTSVSVNYLTPVPNSTFSQVVVHPFQFSPPIRPPPTSLTPSLNEIPTRQANPVTSLDPPPSSAPHENNAIVTPAVDLQSREAHSTQVLTQNTEQDTPVTLPPPPSPVRSQHTIPNGVIAQLPFQSTPRQEPDFDGARPSQLHLQINSQAQQSFTHERFQIPLSASMYRKRQREDDDEDEDEDEIAFKSRKRSEGLSIREGGVVVRKVVSMVRDTLTGLNDLLEIAAEQELIPSEKLRGRNKGKARATESLREESPIYTPTTPSPLTQTPVRSRTRAESSDILRLNEELRSMKAEVAQLKEQKTTETPLEQDHVRAMRTELEALREQIRVLKEAKMAQTEPSEPSEVRVMRDEIASLKNEMRSLQNSSRRSSMAPSTPTTPNLSLRYNNQTMAQTIHPLAHLLAVEPDTTPPTPTTAGTAIQSDATQTEGQLAQSARSQSSHSHGDDSSEKQPDAPPVTPHSPAIFDDIPLPVKSKRKARMIFSRS